MLAVKLDLSRQNSWPFYSKNVQNATSTIACISHLAPPAVVTDHLCVCNAGEKCVCRSVFRQPGKELCTMDEIHLQ